MNPEAQPGSRVEDRGLREEGQGPTARYHRWTLQRFKAFTLLELMIVVGIMGIVLTMGVPLVDRLRHEAPLRKGVKDVVEVCSYARALAILQSKAVCVVFHPREGTFAVQGGGVSQPSGPGEPGGVEFQSGPPAKPGSMTSGSFSEPVTIEMLDVDLTEYKDADEVKVWFYPNGVCDELTLILFDPTVERDPRRAISWEVTTGLASVETDPTKLITSRR
jgi:prepilin-type N-terminal cleavage/methylation domain-containing protein